MIKVYEIKNFEAEYIYKNDNFYKYPDYKITNPFHQLDRAETLLQQFVNRNSINIPIQASVVFVNPEFTLYNAPLDKRFILPTQINSLLRKLNSKHSDITNRTRAIVDKLLSSHQEEYPYSNLPSYSYNQLKKGISCQNCKSFSIRVSGYYCYCINCGRNEKIADAVLRTTEEFILLFPNEKITTSIVNDWCASLLTQQRIQRILMTRYNFISNKRWSYFKARKPIE